MRLSLGRFTIATRSEVERLERERDEWRLRAEAMARMAAAAAAPVRPKRKLWATALSVVWILIIGVFIGGMVPHVHDAPTLANSACDAVRSQVLP